ncbi:MAG: hypothetical protein V7L04_07045 [Nostoc sp.]
MSNKAQEIYSQGHLSEVDWKGIRACVKIALAELDDSKPSLDASSNS